MSTGNTWLADIIRSTMKGFNFKKKTHETSEEPQEKPTPDDLATDYKLPKGVTNGIHPSGVNDLDMTMLFGGTTVEEETIQTEESKPIIEPRKFPRDIRTTLLELYHDQGLFEHLMDRLMMEAQGLRGRYRMEDELPLPFIFLDIETTGLDEKKDTLLEFHAIFAYYDKAKRKFIRLFEVRQVNHFTMKEGLSEVVLDMHTENHLWVDCYKAKVKFGFNEGRELTDILTRLTHQFQSAFGHKPTLAGSGVNFDKKWIDHGHLGLSFPKLLNYRVLDATSFYLAYDILGVNMVDKETKDREAVFEGYYPGRKFPGAHRAETDIHMALIRLEKYLNGLGEVNKIYIGEGNKEKQLMFYFHDFEWYNVDGVNNRVYANLYFLEPISKGMETEVKVQIHSGFEFDIDQYTKIDMFKTHMHIEMDKVAHNLIQVKLEDGTVYNDTNIFRVLVNYKE